MSFFTEALRVLGCIFLLIGAGLILQGLIATGMNHGSSAVLELLNPLNVINYVVAVLLLAPGVILIFVSRKLHRQFEKQKSN